MTDRTTPNDLGAETAALGSMMLSRIALEHGAQRLVGEDFWKPTHARIFDAMVDCYHNGINVDPVTLTASLRERGVSEETISRQQLLRIQAETPASANIEHYCDLIIERADRRRLIALAGEITNSAYETTANLDDIVNGAQAALDGVQRVAGARVHPNYATWRETIDMHERWIVPGILERRDRMILVAGEGMGKSHLLRLWALMAAAGVHWFTERPILPAPVLVIDVENSDRQIRRNTEVMHREAHQRVPTFDEDNFVIVPFATLDITRRSDRIRIESYLEGHRPAILVIGPLYKIMPPPGRERSYEEAALEGIHVMDSWRARYDCAVLIEHHAAKGSGGRRDFDPLGSSAFMRWPEFGLKLEQDRDNPAVVNVGHFRGQREIRSWPRQLERGSAAKGEWQWHVPAAERQQMGEEPF